MSGSALVALFTNRYIISKGGVMHAHNDDTATDDDLPDSRSVNVGDVDKDDLMPPKRHVADEDDSDDTDQNKEGELAGTPRLADDVGELESVDVEAYNETHIPGIHNVGTPLPKYASKSTYTSAPQTPALSAETSHADRLRTIERDLSDARSQLKQAQADFQVTQDRVKTMEETVTRLKGDALHALETYKSSLIEDPSGNE